jgi:hypothetical protein
VWWQGERRARETVAVFVFWVVRKTKKIGLSMLETFFGVEKGDDQQKCPPTCET